MIKNRQCDEKNGNSNIYKVFANIIIEKYEKDTILDIVEG